MFRSLGPPRCPGPRLALVLALLFMPSARGSPADTDCVDYAHIVRWLGFVPGAGSEDIAVSGHDALVCAFSGW
jgi:hypothetical protein